MIVSLIDYIGKVENGVAMLFSLSIHDKIYEMIYWINPDGLYTVEIEDDFYKDYPNIENINNYEYLPDLLYYIHVEILPDCKEIFNQFLK
jgi:hypothetical protein